MKNINPTS